MIDPVIHIRGLSKSFGGRRVVDRLDLDVPPGAIFALLGDNGAGKSTTIRLLTGQIQADAGEAHLFGKSAWSASVELRHRVGYMPERPRYYDWMRVRELGQFVAGFHREGYWVRFRSLIEQFNLDDNALLQRLSKGEYARVGLALALASNPELLLLDEPTSGLDLFTRRQFLRSMVDLAGEGRTIFLSSHSVAEIERIASHVAFMSSGRVLLVGTLEDVRQRLIRVRLRHGGLLPETTGLGQILDTESSGRDWQAVVLDPDRAVLRRLQHQEGVHDLEESPLTLEEMYSAVLARPGRASAQETHSTRQPALVGEEKGDRS